jgi:hypothetical protein
MSNFASFFKTLGKKKETKKPEQKPRPQVVTEIDHSTNTITLTDMALVSVAANLLTSDTSTYDSIPSSISYDSSPSYDSSSSSYDGGGGSFSGGGSSDNF